MITIDRFNQKGKNRYHFPTIDFKFQNKGNATAFLWQFGIEVLHVKIDVTPELDFEAEVENNALLIKAVNNGWGIAHNCAIQLEEPLLSLLFSKNARLYSGTIQEGENQEIFRLSKSNIDAKQFELIQKRFETLSYHEGTIKKYGLKLNTMDVSWNCNDDQNKITTQIEPHNHAAHEMWWDIVLTEIGFEKVSYSDPYEYMLSPSDTTYGAIIDPLKGSQEWKYPISRQIPPGDVERFHIMIGSPMSSYLQVRFKFFIDQDVVIGSEAFDIQIWNPRNSQWHLLYIDDAAEYRRYLESRKSIEDVLEEMYLSVENSLPSNYRKGPIDRRKRPKHSSKEDIDNEIQKRISIFPLQDDVF